MARRTKARQVAIQMLYQVDLNPDIDAEALREMIAERLQETSLREFAWSLFSGVMEHRGELDDAIQNVAQNWKINRMAVTDRSVLRLGAFELLKTDTPRGVVIDEAIELSKKFGDAQSPQFVNGILDQFPQSDQTARDNAASE